MNVNSECPERYKQSVIKSLIVRADKICSSNALCNDEKIMLKQIMSNNGFTSLQFDGEFDKFGRRRNEQHNELTDINSINIYCKMTQLV